LVDVDRLFLALGAAFGFLGVALGAMGAHALAPRLSPERLQTFELAARYHLFHALALLAVAWAATRWPGASAPAAGWFLVAGIILLSGSLYTLSLGGPRWFAFITPLGGVAFLIGWALLFGLGAIASGGGRG
jgi:uncharacterized membrane protein YgdD (TMEM256/DUF423 family)